VPAPSRKAARPGRLSALLAALFVLAGCDPDEAAAPAAANLAELPELGLMTSLPLYWPLGAGVEDIASGSAAPPWQRAELAKRHRLVLLDTLSPIAALAPGGAETDPLADLARLAVIQPRGLAPADNVALDDWVRGGGRLLLVLDPQLAGEYDLPLGDPRRPSQVALIPPVLERWGLAIRYDETQELALRQVPLGKATLPLVLAGEVIISAEAARRCTSAAEGAAARCRVGKGEVTVLADATAFESDEASDEARASLATVIAWAFD
jgi:hypothetical protein